MKNKIILLMVLIVVICAFSGVYLLYQNIANNDSGINSPANTQPSAAPSAAPSADTKPALDFTVTDEGGKAVKLSDFKGKPVVLNFWTSWCGYCMQEMPDLNAAYQKNKDVVFLMVNATTADRPDEAKSMKSKYGYDFNVYFDLTGEAARVFNINAFPQTFFIDKNGNILGTRMGAMTASQLDSGIESIR